MDEAGAPVKNVCSNEGWVVDSRELPTDPVDHDVSTLPKLGCTNLLCGLCYQKVRTLGGVMPEKVHGGIDARALYDELAGGQRTILVDKPAFRVYACHCAFHIEGGEQPLDDKEGVAVGTQWSCVGHPVAELPHTFDGVTVTADNIDTVVGDALEGRLPSPLRKSEQRAGVWAARLAVRLDQTPAQERVVAAAARRLTDPDAEIRLRAVYFFVCAPRFAAAMRADALLSEHADLFVGVANPLGGLSTEKTLEYLVWRIVGPELATNAALRELAHVYALDPQRASEALFITLVQYDAAWFTANAAALAQANPNRIDELLFAVDGELPSAVAQAIKSAAPA